jgi:hypothetical protein
MAGAASPPYDIRKKRFIFPPGDGSRSERKIEMNLSYHHPMLLEIEVRERTTRYLKEAEQARLVRTALATRSIQPQRAGPRVRSLVTAISALFTTLRLSFHGTA